MYLSIDIDFWNTYPDTFNRSYAHPSAGSINLRQYLDNVTRLCQSLNIPLHAVMNHHQMLPLVDRSEATTLVNIDMHSDLADSDCQWFNCGTWVGYVARRRTSHYHWICSGDLDGGECNGGAPIWMRNGRHRVDLTDWASLQHTFRRRPPQPNTLIRAGECVGVGVCLSPDYSSPDLQDVFYAWKKLWGVPYRKGRLKEIRSGAMRSPK